MDPSGWENTHFSTWVLVSSANRPECVCTFHQPTSIYPNQSTINHNNHATIPCWTKLISSNHCDKQLTLFPSDLGRLCWTESPWSYTIQPPNVLSATSAPTKKNGPTNSTNYLLIHPLCSCGPYTDILSWIIKCVPTVLPLGLNYGPMTVILLPGVMPLPHSISFLFYLY